MVSKADIRDKVGSRVRVAIKVGTKDKAVTLSRAMVDNSKAKVDFSAILKLSSTSITPSDDPAYSSLYLQIIAYQYFLIISKINKYAILYGFIALEKIFQTLSITLIPKINPFYPISHF